VSAVPRALLLRMIDDAIAHRTRYEYEFCRDCDGTTGGICEYHYINHQQVAEEYREARLIVTSRPPLKAVKAAAS
jgi:hypothetical protein